MENTDTYENSNTIHEQLNSDTGSVQQWAFFSSEPAQSVNEPLQSFTNEEEIYPGQLSQYRQSFYEETFMGVMIYFALWVLMLVPILFYQKNKYGLNLSITRMLKLVIPPAIIFSIAHVLMETMVRYFNKIFYVLSRPISLLIALFIMYAIFIKLLSIEKNEKTINNWTKEAIFYSVISFFVLIILVIVILGLSSWASS